MTTANQVPIFTKTPHIAWSAAISTANTAYDGTGTVSTVFTAGAQGSYVREIRFKPLGTNIQTVVRVFVNNGSTNATATNNVFYEDMTLPASGATNTAASQTMVMPLMLALPAGYVINITLGTTVAAGYIATCIGGDY